MLVIRLFRVGKKNQPFFRIVVTDKKNPPRGGRFLEILGFYNPLTKEKMLKQERIKYWISKGAKPSDTAHNLLVKEGVLGAKKIPVHRVRNVPKQDSEDKKQVETLAVDKNKKSPTSNGTREVSKEEKKETKEETPKEETPKEETPKEETPKEETPKETLKEETPKEEAKKEEAKKKEGL